MTESLRQQTIPSSLQVLDAAVVRGDAEMNAEDSDLVSQAGVTPVKKAGGMALRPRDRTLPAGGGSAKSKK